jgi:hypothetical protein
MKALVALLLTIALLTFVVFHYGDRILRSQRMVGKATIRLAESDAAILTESLSTQLVTFAMASNSLAPADWRFVPSVQDTNMLITTNVGRTNRASLVLTNITNARRLIANLELTNRTAKVLLSWPK